jgi:preprotein translocase subunit Sec61beta
MPSTKKYAPRHERVRSLVLAAGLVAFFFLYALWRLDPTLMYEAQEPVFFILRGIFSPIPEG